MCSCVRHSMRSSSIRKLLDKSFLLRLGLRNHLSINGQILTLLTVSCFVWWISHLCCQVNHSSRQFMPSNPARERDAGCSLRVTGTLFLKIRVAVEFFKQVFFFSAASTTNRTLHSLPLYWSGEITERDVCVNRGKWGNVHFLGDTLAFIGQSGKQLITSNSCGKALLSRNPFVKGHAPRLSEIHSFEKCNDSLHLGQWHDLWCLFSHHNMPAASE